jgi:GTP-binding protein
MVASAHQNTLVTYRFHPEFKGERGQHGMGSNRTGRSGVDMVLEVPPGTVAYEKTERDLIPLADMTTMASACSSPAAAEAAAGTPRSPPRPTARRDATEPGRAGEARTLQLRLKLLADVGLVGFPNTGKSTLVSRISAARPKIADYPFTTLTPNLGVVLLSGDRSFVVADVPGLIEGAHLGHGLGTKFLAHLERTKVLVHVIDVSSASERDPVEDYEIICKELALFAGAGDEAAVALADKPQIAAANKTDALDDPARLARLKKHLKKKKVPLYPISAATGEGLDELLEAMWREVARAVESAVV